MREDAILRDGPGQDGLGLQWFTVPPFHVGIVVHNGKVADVFSEDRRRLPLMGNVRTYIASTAPFTLTFWLKDPEDTQEPDEGTVLDQDLPVLTSDGEVVTGRIDLTLRVTRKNVEYLFQLLRQGSGVVMRRDVSDAIKGELLAKVLALDIHKHTAKELRGNRDLFGGIYESVNVELASTIRVYGLRLDNFTVMWGLTRVERGRLRKQRHGEPEPPPEPPPPPGSDGLRDWSMEPEPPPEPPLSPEGNTMRHAVYEEKIYNYARVHEETCTFWQGRKRGPINIHENEWHGPYGSLKDALRGARATRRSVVGCKKCKTHYSAFFQPLIDTLREKGFARATKASGRNWFNTGSGFTKVEYWVEFAGSRREVRVQVFIGREREWNKRLFDQLEERKEIIESKLGESLSWERLDHRYACRIAVYRPGTIDDNPERLEEIREWAIEWLFAFRRVFGPILNELVKQGGRKQW